MKLAEDLNNQIQKLLTDAKAIADETWEKDKPMSDKQGEEYEKSTKEAIKLQKELDRLQDDAVKSLTDHRNNVRDTAIMPEAATNGSEFKEAGEPYRYLSPGRQWVESKEFRDFLAAGKPLSGSSKYELPGSLFGEECFLGLDKKAWSEREKTIEGKALPTVGSGVIVPQRLGEVVRQFEFDRPVARDLVRRLSTDSNAITYVRITSAQPTAATTVAAGAAKPESTVVLENLTVSVRTMAVWTPVTEQQLEDIPQIRSIVDDYMRFDLARLEEYQMIWGGGTGEDLLGIMNTSGVEAFTRDLPGTETILDKIRGAITDIRVDNLEPNGLVIHPEDWETIALLKGTDAHYLAQVFPTSEGQYRAWGLTVVETPATTAYRSANTTDQRVIIVGDFMRGATLWDRHQTRVEVGYVNDDFTKNRRTIRAEQRVAFAVQRPDAFKYIQTVAAVV